VIGGLPGTNLWRSIPLAPPQPPSALTAKASWRRKSSSSERNLRSMSWLYAGNCPPKPRRARTSKGRCGICKAGPGRY